MDGHTLSRQALHDILRKLLRSDVVVKRGTRYSINIAWALRLHQALATPLVGKTQGDVSMILDMNEGDKFTFEFGNPANADKYWWNVFKAIDSVHPQRVPLIIYYPHPWFYFADNTSEKQFIENISSIHNVYYGIGGDTAGDKQFKSEITTDKVKVNLGVSLERKSDFHINVQGDFITEMITDKKYIESVDKLFSKDDLNDLKSSMSNLANTPHRTKLRVQKNSSLANKLRTSITKDFYVPKSQIIKIR